MSAYTELQQVAKRVVWFKPSEEALADKILFLAHLMTYGTIEDIATAKKHYSPADFREALERAPSGVFDPRSWAYWNAVFDRLPVPEMPRRRLP